ncbi:orotidine-5'-phosphate decarboxylase [Enteractinococcus coprophilus]|uniref:Orotidine 5'-phosphate decarboxylase n=1 Tax=Enteractinococcus coprophilus TaxID=1027633 RepID=A0A543AJI4_9MICC|nr:orotidine-5'-phosphate decarboxylase [Enteractinococcus coprophilus]TQL72745.1 orotidine-5'-phosphate decarboxylase [Enteractinococcus coprophilus]
MFQPFGSRLAQAMDHHGPLCLGIDPHPHLLNAWGLNDDTAGLATFSQTVVEAAAETTGVAALKPQVALYERFGSAGFAILEDTLQSAREASILTIADAKRGDIGSTMEGYAQAWLADGSALVADAVTLTAYLGYESLRPAIDLALSHNRGVFVLALTSNPEGASVQHLGPEGDSVAKRIVDAAARDNATAEPLGSVGLVVGATVTDDAKSLNIDLVRANAPILAPGYGAQGAQAADIRQGFGQAWKNVLVNSSRGILQHGPKVADLKSAIADARKDLIVK